MKIKCEYCGSFISDSDEKCTSCGATNNNLKRNANNVPETIEQLKQWYVEHNLPDENITRFFIGKNYTEPKAFGIYKDEDTQNFIVYKNKSDGKRTVRYEGKDEKYAVNELYLKLKEEIINQKSNSKNAKRKKHAIKIETIVVLMIIFIVMMVIIAAFIGSNRPSRGYYKYNDKYYYYQSGTWYINLIKEEKTQITSLSDKWKQIDIQNIPIELQEESSKYFKSQYHNDEYRIGNASFCSEIMKLSMDANVINTDYDFIKEGYYQSSNGDYYYFVKGFWFLFDTSDLGDYEYNHFCNFEKEKTEDWEKVEYIPTELSESYKEYFLSSTYNSDYSATNFEYSTYYDDDSESDSSWDSDWDSDWDSSDSWDSSSTDWSSDW